MDKRIFRFTSLMLICLAAGTSAVFAQGRYARVYTRGQVDNFVRQLETSSDAFHIEFRREVDSSGLNNSTRRTFIGYADQFENAVDRLRTRFNSNDAWWESRNEVRNLISNSQNLNSTMNSAAFRRRIERQWNRLRDDINRLADTYDLPGLNGGGWTGGGGGGFPGGGGGGGNVPRWALGTFYGRNPQTGGTITLDIENNGRVAIRFDNGEPNYARLNGTTLNNRGIPSRVSRLNNGIRTTALDSGETIDYFRDPQGPIDGGWDPGGGGGGNVPDWALGTFFGRNPQTGGTIRLDIEANGTVAIRFDNGQPNYARLNGTTLTNRGIQSRVSRLRNGIRTTALDSGEAIDYYRR